ncbi:MAG: four helix bundle protein [Pyrinomonadaceae bacterium]|nr:four helix bundle protein [Pyrinomonadaceae bacterium]
MYLGYAVKLYKYLTTEHKEYVLAKQVLRSGTSIGANGEEAKHAQSKTDFVHKLSIAQKEAGETNYWFVRFNKSDYLDDRLADSLLADRDEIHLILNRVDQNSKEVIEEDQHAELTYHHCLLLINYGNYWMVKH